MALDCRLPLLPPIDFGPSSWTTTWSMSVLLSFISGRSPFAVRSFDARKFWNNFRVPLVIRFFSLSLSALGVGNLGRTRFRFRIQVAPFHLVFAVVVVVVLTSITFE